MDDYLNDTSILERIILVKFLLIGNSEWEGYYSKLKQTRDKDYKAYLINQIKLKKTKAVQQLWSQFVLEELQK